ncbi:MAG: DUF6268 family outer membrane beta-barrel protein [Planctomycetota bacterium]
MHRIAPLLVAPMLALLATPVATAQPTGPDSSQPAPFAFEEPAEEAARRPDKFSLSVSYRPLTRFTADLDASSGNYSVTSHPIAIRFDYAATQNLRLNFGVEGEISNYDFDDASTLIPGTANPFDDVYAIRFNVGGFYRFDDTWSALVTGFIGSGFEEDADFGDGLQGGGVAGVLYNFSPSLTLGGGVVVSSRIEDDPLIVPYVYVKWDITDRWTLQTEGLGLELIYDIDEQFSIYAAGGFDRREFVLDDDGPLPEGIVRDRAVLVGGGFRIEPNALPGLSLSIDAGAVVYQEFEILDRDGDDFRELESDPTGYLGVSLRYRF